MKKIFSLVCALLLAVPAFAQYDRDPNTERAGYVNAASAGVDGVVKSGPTYVYAVTQYATGASSSTLLYDTTTLVAANQPKIEVAESVAANTKRYVYDPPLKFDNGVYADVTSGSVVIEYR